MPVDPQVQALLDAAAAMGLPRWPTLTPEEARSRIDASRIPLPPEPVARLEDRLIPGPAGDLPVRIYAPQSDAPLAALVYFHGGGFVIGSIEYVDDICRRLANAAQCAVISVGYRLAPEHQFPAAADDCYAATVWTAEHADEIGVDASRIAVGGDSAGGDLAAVSALMARDRRVPPLVFQLLLNPVTNFDFATDSYRDNADGYFLTAETMRWFWGHYLARPEDGRHPYASPLQAKDLSGLPPALIITAEFDPLRDEGEAYAARLRDAGVSVTCSRYDGMVHSFYTMSPFVARADDAVAEAGAALRAAFGGVTAAGA